MLFCDSYKMKVISSVRWPGQVGWGNDLPKEQICHFLPLQTWPDTTKLSDFPLEELNSSNLSLDIWYADKKIMQILDTQLNIYLL